MLATNGRVRWELEREGVDAELKPKRCSPRLRTVGLAAPPQRVSLPVATGLLGAPPLR